MLKTKSQMTRSPHVERTRAKIRSTRYIKLLDEFIEGKREMTNTQVMTALKLVNKCVPDLAALKVDVDHSDVRDITHVPTWKLLEAIEGEVVK
jgi:hypothetical protein